MSEYWVITASRRHRQDRKAKWPSLDLHIDKLSRKVLINRLKSNYYGKVKWISIKGTMCMVHRLLDHNIDTEPMDEYHSKGLIIYGEEQVPIPVEVVTEYNLESAWLRHEHDFIGNTKSEICSDGTEEVPEAGEDGKHE